ncbi:hypothetical protein QQZ08_005099 [Neonectria magnoliae]|uniref:Copper-fist domain-containing protein n=1 Tax=Neonectria magnoliae TaxID=2732573 RepID=A0ABR1I641_9HYPO
MIIDGEKFACEACVRGHRVSNCQHSDRPLQHINKKGRPVSQCAHCRAMRKSRAAHIKCDCGEKTSKCAHLQPTVDGHKETCCCNHGGRCTCSGKKEPGLDTVPESDSEGDCQSISTTGRVKAPTRRRRANTVHSDGVLTFDQNGHHKPAHRSNRVAQKCSPYTLSRVNSAHSTGSLGTDSLMQKGTREAPGPRARASSTREPRRVKSETASPLMSGNPGFQNLNSNLPPLDLSGIEYPPYMANSTFDLFGSGFNSETDGPMYSAGLSAASVDWSHYDLSDMKGESFTPSSYSQAGAQSFNGLFDFGSGSEQLPHLANTTSTSGEVSEVEDFMPGGDADFDGLDGFGTTSAFLRQNNMMASSTDLTSIDYDSFYKGPDTGPIAGAGMSMVEEDPAFWMPNYNEGIATTMDDSPDPLGPTSMPNLWEM